MFRNMGVWILRKTVFSLICQSFKFTSSSCAYTSFMVNQLKEISEERTYRPNRSTILQVNGKKADNNKKIGHRGFVSVLAQIY